MGNRLLMDQGQGNVISYTHDLGDQLLATAPAGPDEALCGFEPYVKPPYSGDALALRYTMHERPLLVEQASVSVVGGPGTWDANNHWLFTLEVRDASLQPVRTLATATYQQAGAGLVRLPVVEQAVDGSASPELTVRAEKIGRPGSLLAVAGSATVWEDLGGAWIHAGDNALPKLLPAPYHRDALGLLLPLAAGHTYQVEAAVVEVAGASGTWDGSNHWLLSLESRSAGLGVESVLATATFDTGGQATVALTPPSPVAVDGDTTPILAVTLRRVGSPGLLAGANATLAFASSAGSGITSITYDQNGNTLSEAGASGTTTYTWDAEDRLVKVEAADGAEHYTYAADGLRRRKVTAAGTTQFVWDGQNLLAELDPSTGSGQAQTVQTTAQQTDFPGYWGGLASRREGGESAFFAFDMSGNMRTVMDGAAAVTGERMYSAFGPELAGAEEEVGFGGQVGYYRDEAERRYVRARHYQPGMGRWMSRDPISTKTQCPKTFNTKYFLLADPSHGFRAPHRLDSGLLPAGPYRYIHNRPLHFTDPTGLQEGLLLVDVVEGFQAGFRVSHSISVEAAVRRGTLLRATRDIGALAVAEGTTAPAVAAAFWGVSLVLVIGEVLYFLKEVRLNVTWNDYLSSGYGNCEKKLHRNLVDRKREVCPRDLAGCSQLNKGVRDENGPDEPTSPKELQRRKEVCRVIQTRYLKWRDCVDVREFESTICWPWDPRRPPAGCHGCQPGSKEQIRAWDGHVTEIGNSQRAKSQCVDRWRLYECRRWLKDNLDDSRSELG